MEACPKVEQAPDRNVWVCVKSGCRKCTVEDKCIPETCEFKILHALSEDDGGLKRMPRRSGKTTKIVRMVNELSRANEKVYVVTRNKDMENRLKSLVDMRPNVSLASIQTAGVKWKGGMPGYVFFDEVMPEMVGRIMNVMCGSIFVAAYFTPRCQS